MTTLETLNTKCVDIFLGFPTNFCVSYADKPSNAYGHWKIARGEKFDESLETNQDFKDGRRFGSRTEPR
jgi:hypothetical protein